MNPLRYSSSSKKHYTQEGVFHKEVGHHFVSEQWSSYVSDSFHKAWPVGTKLETHRNAGYHTQGESESEYLDPEVINIEPYG
ncbi:hypothetical protein OFN55_28080, partial [Escherichia coli]|nr:hypothetical protein [Escherichia coli]